MCDTECVTRSGPDLTGTPLDWEVEDFDWDGFFDVDMAVSTPVIAATVREKLEVDGHPGPGQASVVC